MTQESASGQAVAERVRAADIAVGGNSPVTAMLANSLKERKPLADTGELYDSIQAAENDASAFIFVPPGTFNESVTIDTAGLTLLGSGRATLINGGTSGDAITIGVSNVTVSNLSVQTTAGAGNTYRGVLASTGANRCTIRNVTVRDSDNAGIEFQAGADHTVVNCTVENSDGNGIYTTGSPRCIIIGNLLTNNGGDQNDSGIDIRSNDTIAVNNIVQNSAQHNVYIGPAADDSLIGGNRLINGGDHGIRDRAVDSILFNNRVSDATNGDISSDNNGTLDGNLTG